MTRIGLPSSSGSSSTTVHTRERSASPEYVGGVSTHTKRKSERASAFTSSVNVNLAPLRASSSGISGSWNGTSPRRRASILRGTMSRMTTSCPRSAKQAPVTSPTQPAPKMPTCAIAAAYFRVVKEDLPRPLPARQRLQALGDRDHRLVRERVEERVHHPVRGAVRAQDDHVQLRPGVVEVVRPPIGEDVAEAVVGERRRVEPVRLLDPPVLVRARVEDK